MSIPQRDLQLIRMLSERLEHIPADTVWARRASGVRRSLLRYLDFPDGPPATSQAEVNQAIKQACFILEATAKHSCRS
ncbi:MAG TPA: hypothetical protein VNK49_12735 [Anaerolineales bacterium]|nr:hypothetical protein [Anaerolineales bacterium]